MKTNNTSAKRSLIDEIEACSSRDGKRPKIDDGQKKQRTNDFGKTKSGKSKLTTTHRNKSVKKVNKGSAKSMSVVARQMSQISDNNNAVPSESRKNKGQITPIIQTRGMKLKARLNKQNPKVTEQDFHYYDDIDKLTLDEFAAGEEQNDDDGPCHDGVEITIPGSTDLDDFPEDEPSSQAPTSVVEPGEIITKSKY